MNNSTFKAYDVRGVYPDEITKDDAYKIGFATVKFLQAKSAGQGIGKRPVIVIGEDCRLSSPALRGAVVDAVTSAGADVRYIGLATTPLFYFSVNKSGADGGIMVTASHNPPQYGGLKIVGSGAGPIGSETGLKDIEKLAMEGNFEKAIEAGTVEEVSFIDAYVTSVIKSSRINPTKLKKLKIVVDAGNGMTPLVVGPLFDKLGIQYTPMYFDIDCNFPNHSPDISKAEALVALKKKVREIRADLGVAFDGDGDRVFFVDEKGETAGPEFILALLYENSGGFFSKPRTVYDLRASKSVKELFSSRGLRSRPGHSFIKQVMRENDAELGGELSGHFFFKEVGYAESSVLAMLKILRIMQSGKSLSELVRPFRKYYHSGEINLPISSREEGGKLVEKLKEKYKEGRVDELDGVTVEFDDWWFNLRLSNTEPIARLVVEAGDKTSLLSRIEEIKKALS